MNRYKVNLLLAVGILLSTASIAIPPCDEHSCFASGYRIERSRQNEDFSLMEIPVPPVSEYYTPLFGACPTYIIWDDLESDVRFEFHTMQTSPDHRYGALPPAWNDSTLTWGELRQYLRLQLTQVGSSDTTTIPVIWGDSSKVVVPQSKESCRGSLEGTWFGRFELSISELPIDNWNKAWKLWLEPQGVSIPPACISAGEVAVDTLILAKRTRSTSMDTLIWVMTDKYERLTFEQSESLRRSFPNNIDLLRKSFIEYYNAENCDSVKSVGYRLMDILDNKSDPFQVEGTTFGYHDKPDQSVIMHLIATSCGWYPKDSDNR